MRVPFVYHRPAFDLLLVVGLVLLGLGVRLAFTASGPPVMVTTDSITYVLPAYNLASGQEFDLTLRRTPGYPLYLAASFALTAFDLQAVAWGQHLLGVATIVAIYCLGQLSFGRLAALAGGLAAALSGPQLIYEHYLMSEALFTFLLVLGMLALAAAVRRGDARLYVAAGVVFGLCAITRPLGQLFLGLVPLAALLATRSLRRTVLVSLVAGLGLGLVFLPGMVRNYVVGGSFTGSAALGKTLFGRITRHDDGMRFDLPPAGSPERDPERARARQLVRQAAQGDTSRGSLVHAQLMREFGYTEPQAYNVMRDTALEVLLAQPGYWLSSSVDGAARLFLGREEPLREHFARLSGDRLRTEWREAGLGHLLPPEVRPEVRWAQHGLAGQVTRLYEPSREPVNYALTALFAAGALAALTRPAWRPLLVVPLLALVVVFLSALLDGPVARFRYPLDPLIAVVAGGGVTALVALARGLWAGRFTHGRQPSGGRPAGAALADRGFRSS